VSTWLTTAQVASRPDVQRSQKTIERHIRAGLLPARKDPISGRWWILEADAKRVYGAAAVNPADVAARIDRATRRGRLGVLRG